ncbi:hypothetical protein ABH926_010204 [Catenulispora sp. GP43]|uniref:hypothetical protein n=1 Tax=Catenulispora sp. GP43 TaxID=3156263 RepID=UPI0035176505
MAGIDDILAEQARRLAERESLQDRLTPVLEDFVARATGEQAACFAAACAERAAGILLWNAASEGREAEADVYLRAVEQLWTDPTESPAITQDDLQRLYELSHHYESGGKAAGFAELAARVLWSALAVTEKGEPSAARSVSSTTLKIASGLEKATGTSLEADEADRQAADMRNLIEDGSAEELKATLREQSRAVGRDWLALAQDYARS